MMKEVFESAAFDQLRQMHGGRQNFLKFIEEKIEAVEGDIVQE